MHEKLCIEFVKDASAFDRRDTQNPGDFRGERSPGNQWTSDRQDFMPSDRAIATAVEAIGNASRENEEFAVGKTPTATPDRQRTTGAVFSRRHRRNSLSINDEPIAKHGMFTDNFRRLAEVLKTSPDELRSRIGSDAIELSALNMAERSEEFSSGVSGQAQPIREVTQFNGISAGPRAERTDLQRGKVKVPRDFGDFFVRVDGESMTPDYPNDSVAIFEMVDGQTFVFGKEYLIWFTNGECYFSSVYENDDDRDVIVLRKLHTDRERFPDRQIHRREIDRIARCIGVLIHRR